MKIRLTNDADYQGLLDVNFPVVVEAKGTKHSSMFYVPFSDMLKIPGFQHFESDADHGEDYAFFYHEVEVVG
ncbi:hypothetical protein K0A11_21370 [Salmonella enterica subsp. enterica serovar Mbandaka]|nr:hypothetical protein [Salmonella enterica subsp. enterica serovar Mbandaka]MCR3282339.1 hypothetical protein [Salmonella enterica subsp. enterica serovar Mbandaka]MCR3316824.1 hypothetical protein [Salmonella enterica subsp. enterica serovar Mbandaka]